MPEACNKYAKWIKLVKLSESSVVEEEIAWILFCIRVIDYRDLFIDF